MISDNKHTNKIIMYEMFKKINFDSNKISWIKNYRFGCFEIPISNLDNDFIELLNKNFIIDKFFLFFNKKDKKHYMLIESFSHFFEKFYNAKDRHCKYNVELIKNKENLSLKVKKI